MKTSQPPHNIRLLAVLAATCAVAFASRATITGVAGGDGAPPVTLGPYPMTLFGPDAAAELAVVSSVATPIGGSVGFSPNLTHLLVPTSWATWSHGYTGDAYWTHGGTAVTLTLPANTGAFFFYAQPNDAQVFDILAESQDGSQILQSPDGNAGATYYGFFATGGDTIQTVTVTSSLDFAIGEFGIANTSAIPETSTYAALVALTGIGGWRWLRRRASR